MKITIEPTTQVIECNGVPCRVWEGLSDDDTRCTLFVVRVAISKDEPPERSAVFERELTEQREPTVSWPLRMIL